MSTTPARRSIPWFTLVAACALPLASPWLYPSDWLDVNAWAGLGIVASLVLAGRLVSGAPWLGLITAVVVDGLLFLRGEADAGELPAVALLLFHAALLLAVWRSVSTPWSGWRRWLLLALATVGLSAWVWTTDPIVAQMHFMASVAGFIFFFMAVLAAPPALRWNGLWGFLLLVVLPASGLLLRRQMGMSLDVFVLRASGPDEGAWVTFWVNEPQAAFAVGLIPAVIALVCAVWRAVWRGTKQLMQRHEPPTPFALPIYLCLAATSTVWRLPGTFFPILVWWVFLLVFLAFDLLHGIGARMVLKPPEGGRTDSTASATKGAVTAVEPRVRAG